MRIGLARRSAAVALAALVVLPLGLAACASREGSQRALSDGMVRRDRQLARTPDQIDFNRPAWQRDWTPTGDPSSEHRIAR